MTTTDPEFATAFEPHPLEGSSRFSLLGLLAGLSSVTKQEHVPFDDSVMGERERFAAPTTERTTEGTK